MSERVRAQPCEACPYRRDVASGVWSAEEYDKLPPYDAETFEQPFDGFACHATPEFYCHGWAVVHMGRGHEFELLALRFAGLVEIPTPPVPLFESGAEAAAHGKREIKRPKKRARQTVQRLMARYPRLRQEKRTDGCTARPEPGVDDGVRSDPATLRPARRRDRGTG